MEVGLLGKFAANTKEVILHVYRVFSKGLQFDHMTVDLHKNCRDLTYPRYT